MDVVDTTKVTGLKKAAVPESIKLYQDLGKTNRNTSFDKQTFLFWQT